jgi:RHS repeat-associated protein
MGFRTALFGLVLVLLCPGLAKAQSFTPGAIPHHVVVGSGGSLESSVTIPVLPGTAGMQPTLSLSYDSQAPIGAIGSGWSISGLAQITRGPRNWASDGVTAPVGFTSNDAFFFNGQRLIPVSESNQGGTKLIEFRKEVDDHAKITAYLGSNGDPARFTVRTKAGLTLELGGSSNANVQVGSSTAVWLVRRIQDTSGNYIDFEWLNTNGDFDIAAVSYSGHATAPVVAPFAEVRFDYETVDPYATTYIAGFTVQKGRRLKTIRSRLLSPAVDAYTISLTYADVATSTRFNLTGIDLRASDGKQYRPLQFSYTTPVAKPWVKSAALQLPADLVDLSTSAASRFVRLNPTAGSAPALMHSADSADGLKSSVYSSEAGGWTRVDGREAPTAFVDVAGKSLGIAIVDLDADGRDDILSARDQNGVTITGTWRQTPTGWDATSEHRLPFAIARDGVDRIKFFASDISADGKADLVGITSNGTVETLINTGTAWSRLQQLSVAEAAVPPALLDADCDGAADMVTIVRKNGVFSLIAYKFSQNGWSQQTGAGWQLSLGTGEAVNWAIDEGRCGFALIGIRDAAGMIATHYVTGALTGWSSSADRAPPPIAFWKGDGRVLSPRVVDLNGDKLSDLLVNEAWSDGASASEAFLQLSAADASGAWWRVANGTGEFSSPFQLAVDGRPRNSVAFRRLDSDDSIDVIDLEQRGPGKPGAYINNGVTWASAANLTPPLEFARLGGADQGIRFLDLNGDGLVDLVYNRKTKAAGNALCADGAAERGAFINRGDRWECVEGYIPPHEFPSNTNSAAGVAILDVDNDGFVDLVYSYRAASGAVVHETRLNGFARGRLGWDAPSSVWRTPEIMADERTDAAGTFRFLDVNGDGRVDLIRSYETVDGKINTTYLENNGGGWQTVNRSMPGGFIIYRKAWTSSPAGIPAQVTHSELVDINGDRALDYVERYFDQTLNREISRVSIWDGAQFKEIAGKAPVRLDLRDSQHGNFMDVNGDGLPDYYHFDGSTGRIYVGTGVGWALQPALEIPKAAISKGFKDAATRFVDLNGDGLLDIAYYFATDPGKYESGAYFNLGNRWTSAPAAYAPQTPFFSEKGEDLGVRPLDVDGNGLPDLIKSVRNDAGLNQEVWLNIGRRSGTLEALVSGDGVKTRVMYQSLSEYRAIESGAQPRQIYEHGKASSYPSISIAPAMYVVARLVTDEGNGRERATRFRYGDLRLDVLWSRSTGFRWKESVDEDTGITTRTTFSQERWQSGVVLRETSTLVDNGVSRTLTDTQSDWKALERTSLPRSDGQPYRFASIRMLSTRTTLADLDGAAKTSETNTFEHDDDGNVSSSRTVRGDGSGVLTANEYASDAEARWLGRLTAATVTKYSVGHDQDAPCSQPACDRRRAEFTYIPGTFLLETELANAQSSDHALRTTYARDPFGNITRKTMRSVKPGVPDRVEAFTYVNGQGRLLETKTGWGGDRNENSYSTPFNVALGIPSSVRDGNGLIDEQDHDGFGRVTKQRDASGTERSHSYVEAGAIPASYLARLDHGNANRSKACIESPLPIWQRPQVGYAIISQQFAGVGGSRLAPSAVIYDRGGRQIRAVTSIFDGTKVRLAFVDNEFDSLGRLRGQSRPYFADEKSYWSTIQNDRLGREIATANADGSCVRASYSGPTKIVETRTSSAKPWRRTISRFTPQGTPQSVQDPAGGVVRYGYDAANRVLTITGATGATIRYTYDAAGFQSGLFDPDSGNWTYRHDAFGQRRSQHHSSDALNPRTMEYDAQGRVTRSLTQQHDTRWTYRNTSQTCGYNRVGSVSKTALNSGSGPSYEEEYEYDSFCRAVAVTIRISSSPAAPIAEMLPANPLKSTTSYDEFGRPLIVTYPSSFSGSSFAVRNSYHSETGALVRVDEWKASNQPGRKLWTLAAADAAGRVIKEGRGDALSIGTSVDTLTGRTIGIDASASGGKLFGETYKYDGIGNLVGRQDASGSTYSYDFDALDRLTAVRNGTNVIQSASYDAAGRITQKSGVGSYRYGSACGALSPQEWRPSHAPCAIAANATAKPSETFSYDSKGNLVRSATALFEIDADGRVVRTTQRDLTPGAPVGAETEFREYYGYGPTGEHFLTYSSRVRWGAQPAYRQIASFKLGLYELEVRRTKGSTSRVQVDRWYVRSGTTVVGFVESADYRSAAVGDMPAALSSLPVGQRVVLDRLAFLVHDRLGSVRLVTNDAGRPIQRFEFDPWGRATSPSKPPVDVGSDGVLGRWSVGFTGQEHLAVGAGVANLVHMGGRIYDSRLGIFLTPDPQLIDPTSSQDLNPYIYALGNPLFYTDPTGNGWFSDFIRNPFKAIEDLHRNFLREAERGLKNVGHWVERDWREIAGVAVGIVIVVYCPPCMANPIVGGFLVGAAQSGTTVALYGGNASEVLGASMRGGAIGAVGGATAYAAGSYIQTSGVGAQSWQAAAAHGVGGGVTSVAGGGRFESGFASGALTQAITQNTRISELKGGARVAANAALGGANAEIGGGKFANGAMYGAFQVMFNDWLHPPRQAEIQYNKPAPATVPVSGQTAEALQCLANCLGEKSLYVTGGAEKGGHSRTSLHYQDKAVDIPWLQPSGRRFTNQEVFYCSSRCGFDHGQYEPHYVWRARAHWHLQTAPGARVPKIDPPITPGLP